MGNRLLSLEKKLFDAGLGSKVSMAKNNFGMAFALYDNYKWELFTATEEVEIAEVIRKQWGFTKGVKKQDNKIAVMLQIAKTYNSTKSIKLAKNLKLKKDDKMYIPTSYQFDEKYKDIVFKGSVFPDDPIKTDKKVTLGDFITKNYLPTMEAALKDETRGMRLLCTVFTKQEGFSIDSRSYKTKNPGNIGNTDSGKDVIYDTLEKGIMAQKQYFESVAAGKRKGFPKIGDSKGIKVNFSPEIAKNFENYQISPYLPGYDFTYTGQLDQFIKYYATGARAGNGYLSTIISYFKANGLMISETSTIQDIIKMN